MVCLIQFQDEVKAWAGKNFPGTPAYRPLLGVAEEVGELSHAHLKSEQNIRKDEDHEADGKDAIGDIMVYLAHYCSVKGWSLNDCVHDAWYKVGKRDWAKFPNNGVDK